MPLFKQLLDLASPQELSILCVENAPGSMDMRWARFYSGLAQVSPNPLVEARAAEHDEEAFVGFVTGEPSWPM